MSVKYEIDGDIFREMRGNWLFVHVKEFLIKARKVEKDQAGNVIEYLQLNDGRIFSRQKAASQPMDEAQHQQISVSQLSVKSLDEASAS
jgi:hypothetical protein